MNSIINVEQLRQIVNSTNSFPREVLLANKDTIRELRAEKKARLATVTPNQLAAVMESRGFQLVSEKLRTLKNGTPQVTWVLRGAQDEAAKIKAQIAKLTKALEGIASKSDAVNV